MTDSKANHFGITHASIAGPEVPTPALFPVAVHAQTTFCITSVLRAGLAVKATITTDDSIRTTCVGRQAKGRPGLPLFPTVPTSLPSVHLSHR